MKNYFDQIADYLEGTLSESNRIDFEQQINVNSELAKEVEEQTIAYEVVDVLVQERLKKQLKTLQKERDQKNKFSIKRYLIPIAASLLLVTIIGFYWKMTTSYSDQGLVASHFEVYDASGIRGGHEATDFNKAIDLYSSKQYSAALQEFKQIPVDHPLHQRANLLAANAAIKINNNKEAIDLFSKVITSNDSRFKPAAQWYQGLAFLQNGQPDLAQKIFRTIASEKGHSYQKKANMLLEDMKSFWRK